MSESGHYSDAESTWSRRAKSNRGRSFRKKSFQDKSARQTTSHQRRRSASFHNVYIASSTDSYSNHEKFDSRRRAPRYNVGDASNLKNAWKLTSSTSNLASKALLTVQKEKEILQSFGSLSLTCNHTRSSGKEQKPTDEQIVPVEEDILESSNKPVTQGRPSTFGRHPVKFSKSLPNECPMTHPTDCPIICLPQPKQKPFYYHLDDDISQTINAPQYAQPYTHDYESRENEYVEENMPKGCKRKRRIDCDDKCKAKWRISNIKQNIAQKFENARYQGYSREALPRNFKQKHAPDYGSRRRKNFTISNIKQSRAENLEQPIYFDDDVVLRGCPMNSRSDCDSRCQDKLRRDGSKYDKALSPNRGPESSLENGKRLPGCVNEGVSECDDRCRTRIKTLYRDPEYDEIASYQKDGFRAHRLNEFVPPDCPMTHPSQCSNKCRDDFAASRQKKATPRSTERSRKTEEVQPKMANILTSENVPSGEKLPLGCPFTRREDCDAECRAGDAPKFYFDESITQQKAKTFDQAKQEDSDDGLPENCPMKQRKNCPERCNPPILTSSMQLANQKGVEEIIEAGLARSVTFAAFEDGPNVKATSVTGLGEYVSQFQKEKYRLSSDLIKSCTTLAMLRKKKDFHGRAARRASDSAVNAVRKQKKREHAKRVALPLLKHSRGSHHGGYGLVVAPEKFSVIHEDIPTCDLPTCIQAAKARSQPKEPDKFEKDTTIPNVAQLLTKRPSDNVITRISDKKRADRKLGRPNVRRHPWPHKSYSEHRSSGRSNVHKYNEGLANQIKLSRSFEERLNKLRGINVDGEEGDYITTVGSPVPVGKPVVLIGKLKKPDGTHTKVVILGTVRIRVKDELGLYDSGDSVATLPSVHMPEKVDVKADGYTLKQSALEQGDGEEIVAHTRFEEEAVAPSQYEKTGYFDGIKKAFGKLTKRDPDAHPYICSKAGSIYDSAYKDIPVDEADLVDAAIPVVIGRGRTTQSGSSRPVKTSTAGAKFLSKIPNFKEDEFCASQKLSNKMRVFRHEIRDVTGDQIHHMKAFPRGQETYNKDKLTHKMQFFRKNIREGEDGRLRKWRGGEEGWPQKDSEPVTPHRDLSLSEVVDPKTLKAYPDAVKGTLQNLRHSSRPDMLTPKPVNIGDYGDYNEHDGTLWRKENEESPESNESFYQKLSQVAKQLERSGSRKPSNFPKPREAIFGAVGYVRNQGSCYHVYDAAEDVIERQHAGEQMAYNEGDSDEDSDEYGEVTTVEETYESVEYSEEDFGQHDEDENLDEESSGSEEEYETEDESASSSPQTGTTSTFPVPSSGVMQKPKQSKKSQAFSRFRLGAKRMQNMVIGKMSKNLTKYRKEFIPSSSAGEDTSEENYDNNKFYRKIHYVMNRFTDKMFQMLPVERGAYKETSLSDQDFPSSIPDSSDCEKNNFSVYKKRKREVKRNVSFYWSKSKISTSVPLYEHQAVKEEMHHVQRTLLHITKQAMADNKIKHCKTYLYSRSDCLPYTLKKHADAGIFAIKRKICTGKRGRSKVVIGTGRKCQSIGKTSAKPHSNKQLQNCSLVPQVRCGPKRSTHVDYTSEEDFSSFPNSRQAGSDYDDVASDTSEFKLYERSAEYSGSEGSNDDILSQENSSENFTRDNDYEDLYSQIETSEATGLTSEKRYKQATDAGTISQGHTSDGSILVKSDRLTTATNASSRRSDGSSNRHSTAASSRRSDAELSKHTTFADSRVSDSPSSHHNQAPGITPTHTRHTENAVPSHISSESSFDSQISENIVKTEEYQQKTIDHHENSTRVYIGIRKFKRQTTTHVPAKSKSLRRSVKMHQDPIVRHDVIPQRVMMHDVIPQQVAPTFHAEVHSEHANAKKADSDEMLNFLGDKGDQDSDFESKNKANKFIDGQNICKRHVNTKLCKRLQRVASQSLFTASHSEDSAHLDMYGDKRDTRQRFPHGLMKMGAMDYSSTNVSVLTSWWDEGSDGVKRRTGSLEEGMPPRLDSEEDELRCRNLMNVHSDESDVPPKNYYRGYAAMVYLRGDGILMKNFGGKRPRKCKSKEVLKRNYRHGKNLPFPSIHCLKTFGRLQISSKVRNLDGEALNLLCEDTNCLYARCLDSNQFVDYEGGDKCTKWPCSEHNGKEMQATLEDVEYLLQRGSKRGSSILDSDSDDPVCKFAVKCKRCPIRYKFKPFFPGLFDQYGIIPLAKRIVDFAILGGQELYGKKHPPYTEEDLENFCNELASTSLENGVALYFTNTSIRCSWLDLQSDEIFNDLFKELLQEVGDGAIADELTNRSIAAARRRMIIEDYINKHSPADAQGGGSKAGKITCCFSETNLVPMSTDVADEEIPEGCYIKQFVDECVFPIDENNKDRRLFTSLLPTKILAQQIIKRAAERGGYDFLNPDSVYMTASSSSFPRLKDLDSSHSLSKDATVKADVKTLLDEMLGAVVIAEDLHLDAHESQSAAVLAYNLSQLKSHQAEQKGKGTDYKQAEKTSKLTEESKKQAENILNKRKDKPPNKKRKGKRKAPAPPVSKRIIDDVDSNETFADYSQITSELSSEDDTSDESFKGSVTTSEYDSEFTPLPTRRIPKVIRVEAGPNSAWILKKAQRLSAKGRHRSSDHNDTHNFPKTLKIKRSKIPKSMKKYFKLASKSSRKNESPTPPQQSREVITFSDSHAKKHKYSSNSSIDTGYSGYLETTVRNKIKERPIMEETGPSTCSSNYSNLTRTTSSKSSSYGLLYSGSSESGAKRNKEIPHPSAGFFNPYEKKGPLRKKDKSNNSVSQVFGNVPYSMMKKFGNIAKRLSTTGQQGNFSGNSGTQIKSSLCSNSNTNKSEKSMTPFPSARTAHGTNVYDSSSDQSDYVIFEFVPPQQLISDSMLSYAPTSATENDLVDIKFGYDSNETTNSPIRSDKTSQYASSYDKLKRSEYSLKTESTDNNSPVPRKKDSYFLKPSGKPKRAKKSKECHDYERIPELSTSSCYSNLKLGDKFKQNLDSKSDSTSSQGMDALRENWNKFKRTKNQLISKDGNASYHSEEVNSSTMMFHESQSSVLHSKEYNFKTSGKLLSTRSVTIGKRTPRHSSPLNDLPLLETSQSDSANHLCNKFQVLSGTPLKCMATSNHPLSHHESNSAHNVGVMTSSIGVKCGSNSNSKKCPAQNAAITNTAIMGSVSQAGNVFSLRATEQLGTKDDSNKPPLRIIWQLSETRLSPKPGVSKPEVGLLNNLPKKERRSGIKLHEINSNRPITNKTKAQPNTLVPTAAVTSQCGIKDLISELNNEMEGVCDIFNSSLINCTDRPSEIVESGQFQGGFDSQFVSQGDIVKMLGDLQSTVLNFFEKFKNSTADIFGISPTNEKTNKKEKLSLRRRNSQRQVPEDSDSSFYDVDNSSRVPRPPLEESSKRLNFENKNVLLRRKNSQNGDVKSLRTNADGDYSADFNSQISTQAKIRRSGYLIQKSRGKLGDVQLRRYKQTITATIESSVEEETTSYNSSSEVESIAVTELKRTWPVLDGSTTEYEKPQPRSRRYEKKQILHPSCHSVEVDRLLQAGEGFDGLPSKVYCSNPSNNGNGEYESGVAKPNLLFRHEVQNNNKSYFQGHGLTEDKNETELEGSYFQKELCNHIKKRFPKLFKSVYNSIMKVSTRNVYGYQKTTNGVANVSLDTAARINENHEAAEKDHVTKPDMAIKNRKGSSHHVEKSLETFSQYTPPASSIQRRKEELKSIYRNNLEKANSRPTSPKSLNQTSTFNCDCSTQGKTSEDTQLNVTVLKNFFEDLQSKTTDSISGNTSLTKATPTSCFFRKQTARLQAHPVSLKTLTPSAGGSFVREEPLEQFALTQVDFDSSSEYSFVGNKQDMFTRSVKVSRNKTTFTAVSYHEIESEVVVSDDDGEPKNTESSSRSVKVAPVKSSVSETALNARGRGTVFNNRPTLSATASGIRIKTVRCSEIDKKKDRKLELMGRMDNDVSKNRKTSVMPSDKTTVTIGNKRQKSKSSVSCNNRKLQKNSCSNPVRREGVDLVEIDHYYNDRDTAFCEAKQKHICPTCNPVQNNCKDFSFCETENVKNGHFHASCQTNHLQEGMLLDHNVSESPYINIYPSAGKTKILRNRGNVTPLVQSAVTVNQQRPLESEPIEDKQKSDNSDRRSPSLFKARKQTAVPQDRHEENQHKKHRSFFSNKDKNDAKPSDHFQLQQHSNTPGTSGINSTSIHKQSIDIGRRSTVGHTIKQKPLQPDSVQVGRRQLEREYGPEALRESHTHSSTHRGHVLRSKRHSRRSQSPEEPACQGERRYSSSDYLDGLPCSLRITSCSEVPKIQGTLKSVAREINRRTSDRDERTQSAGFRPVPARLGRDRKNSQSHVTPKGYQDEDTLFHSHYPYPTGMETDVATRRKSRNRREGSSFDTKRETLQITPKEDSEGNESLSSSSQKTKPDRRHTIGHTQSNQIENEKKKTRRKSYPVETQHSKSNSTKSSKSSSNDQKSYKQDNEDDRWHHALRNTLTTQGEKEDNSPNDLLQRHNKDDDNFNQKSLSVVNFLRGTLDRPLRKTPNNELTFRPIYRDNCLMHESPYYRRNHSDRSKQRRDTRCHGPNCHPTTAQTRRTWRLLPSTESLRSLQRFGCDALSNFCGKAPNRDNQLAPSSSYSSDVTVRPSTSKMAVNAMSKIVDIFVRVAAVAFVLFLFFHEEPFQLGGVSPI